LNDDGFDGTGALNVLEALGLAQVVDPESVGLARLANDSDMPPPASAPVEVVFDTLVPLDTPRWCQRRLPDGRDLEFSVTPPEAGQSTATDNGTTCSGWVKASIHVGATLYTCDLRVTPFPALIGGSSTIVPVARFRTWQLTPSGMAGAIQTVATTETVRPEGGPARSPLDAKGHDDSHLSPGKLAEIFDVPAEPLRTRLNRWRKHNNTGWIENPDRGSRDAKYWYRLGSVRHIIEKLKATSKTTGKRPPRKN
jgi:hypothetical protein